mgnify:CR=1 FL=1
MSKEVILEKPEYIIIYKIVEYYKQAKRKDIIDLTKKIYRDLFERDVSDDAVINWIREITGFREEYDEETGIRKPKPVQDIRKKLDILKVRSGGIYEIYEGVKVIPGNKNIWNEVDRYLKIRRENRIISDELRVKHTERIKERIIRPWIEILENKSIEFRKYRYYLSFKEIKLDPLYKDLGNHLPLDLEDPRDIADYIEERKNEFEKLKEELTKELKNILSEIFKERKLKIRIEENDIGWSPDALAGVIVDIIAYGSFDRLNFEKILKRVNISTVNVHGKRIQEFTLGRWIIVCKEEEEELSKENVARTIYEIFSDDRVKKFVKENEKSLKTILNEINENKEKLLKVLKELEAYEILPGVCKYLRGE